VQIAEYLAKHWTGRPGGAKAGGGRPVQA